MLKRTDAEIVLKSYKDKLEYLSEDTEEYRITKAKVSVLQFVIYND